MKPLALVADDYAGITQQLRSALEHSGFEVITAEDGQEALDKFKEERRTFALIVVDYMMPRVKGDAVIGAIKAYLDERNQPAPKMFLLTAPQEENPTTQNFCSPDGLGFNQTSREIRGRGRWSCVHSGGAG